MFDNGSNRNVTEQLSDKSDDLQPTGGLLRDTPLPHIIHGLFVQLTDRRTVATFYIIGVYFHTDTRITPAMARL